MAAKAANWKPIKVDMMFPVEITLDDSVSDLQPLAGNGAGLALKRKSNMGRGLFIGHAIALAR